MVLKISALDFQTIREALAIESAQIFARARWKHYMDCHGTPGNKYYQRDINRVWRWDVFHHVCDNTPGLLKRLYSYLNDENIDVVLRRLLVTT